MVPDWLAEVVRPKPAPVPWRDMIRAALAICVPLAVAFAVGRGTIGVLPAMGGLMGTMSDTGGSYVNRVKRVTSAAVLGGAAGLAIGSVIHGHGWIAVLALTLVAGVSGAISAVGDIGSATGLQLLVYATLGLGPLGAQRPVWHTVAGFVVGAAWALILILPGWLVSPHGQEERDVAAVYGAVAALLRSPPESFAGRRQALTGALSTAYDTLLRGRSTAAGRSRAAMRLIALLNASHLLAEAAAALGVAGTPPPAGIVAAVSGLANAIRSGTPPPVIPPAWDDSPGALALRDAMAAVARLLSGGWTPSPPARERWPGRLAQRYERVVGVLDGVVAAFGGGTLTRLFTVRLMICIGVAGVVTEVLPMQRSYWVPLTVALVLKPDYGSVFGRAVQRAIGTIVGAVAGAVLLVLVHGTWLLIPFAVLASLLPYGRKRNYGLMTTFLTPLVVVLIDLLSPAGWRLAEDRLIDSLIGCAIALVIGFAPWPMTWYAHLPREFAEAALDVAAYMEEALCGAGSRGGRVPVRARTRWATYRALTDVRTEFQRTMAEPPAISRRATAFYPALVGLERVMDATAATALSVSRSGAQVPEASVRELTGAIRAVSEVAATGTPLGKLGKPPELPELPDDEVLKPVTEAVRALLGVLGSGRAG